MAAGRKVVATGSRVHPIIRRMEALREAFPLLSEQEITAAFERVAKQVAAGRSRQPDGWDAGLVRSKSAAAQTDAKELWRAASAPTRSSTRALLSQASAREAAKVAADVVDEVEAAEAELRQIARLLAKLPGGTDATTSLLAPRVAPDARSDTVPPKETRANLALQVQAALSQAESLAEELAAQLVSASQA